MQQEPSDEFPALQVDQSEFSVGQQANKQN